jgi:hypothetical protein
MNSGIISGNIPFSLRFDCNGSNLLIGHYSLAIRRRCGARRGEF